MLTHLCLLTYVLHRVIQTCEIIFVFALSVGYLTHVGKVPIIRNLEWLIVSAGASLSHFFPKPLNVLNSLWPLGFLQAQWLTVHLLVISTHIKSKWKLSEDCNSLHTSFGYCLMHCVFGCNSQQFRRLQQDPEHTITVEKK